MSSHEAAEGVSVWPVVLLSVAVGTFTLYAVRIAQLLRRYFRRLEALRLFPSPRGHWLWGNIPQLGITQGEAGFKNMVNWSQIHGHAFVIYMSRFLPRLELVHHSTAQVLLNTAEPKDGLSYRFLIPWIGDGLLVSSGAKWARNRRLLTPAFHFDILKNYMPLFSDSALHLATKWKKLMSSDNSESFEMFQHLSLFTLDSLLKCVFGLHSNCQQTREQHPYIKAVYELAKLTIERLRFFPYHINFIYALSPSSFRFRRACRTVHNFSQDVIKTRRRERAVNSGQRASGSAYIDFLDILLDARDEDGNGLTDIEIQHEVDTFMFEGHDTTASALSWCLYNLACNPDCQEKCRQEVNDILQDRDNVSWADAHSFTYLTQCLKESLRLSPPVPSIGREMTKPLTLPDGKVIAPGCWAGAHIYSCHRDPSVWQSPDEFNPERFSLENSRIRPSHAFIPFSAGPRNCIGQHFAMLEMKTALAILLKQFTFEVDSSKPPVEVIPELVLRSKHGIWLHVTPTTRQTY